MSEMTNRFVAVDNKYECSPRAPDKGHLLVNLKSS